MNEPIVKKAYYSIGDVCDLTGLKPHVLRYWETQFDILRPTKNRAGNRVYRPKDIELITLVKNLLYEQKYTIEGANKKLLEMRGEGELEEGKQEVLGPEFLASMKGELEELSNILTPSHPLPDETGTQEERDPSGHERDGSVPEDSPVSASEGEHNGSESPDGDGSPASEEPGDTGDLFGTPSDQGQRDR